MPEEQSWYFAKKGKTVGPFSEHELCKQFEAGAFGAEDHVYCKGETEGWVKAGTITGLCDSLSLDAEPEPEHHSVPQYERASYEHSVGKKKVKKQKEKRSRAFWGRLRKHEEDE
ncbi:MAG: DUF4339 domain-containing protein [Planctomycetota bacterium]|jgi:hypothetical protein